MGNVVMKLKVMPTGVDVDLEAIKEKIQAAAPENVEIRDVGIQPIAFGLKALVVAAVMPDEGNVGDEFAEKIQQIEGVESVEIESVELL
ncbi:elongation factor 1-beta [Archaeoglobus veneficus]|uniref:Elongation factor 1-beta n=1 Tax=Archaeoglobus veneficus (strain DSM 11195 / SNP6) TaxID=693661 RepID=F2KRU5_ARCVS|nr:elongation factor 1-beta [Archaeoglobus veneficus]AEA47959.1 Elongation factor 1-beta [Archaeoglobus veneficus SNP6]